MSYQVYFHLSELKTKTDINSPIPNQIKHILETQTQGMCLIIKSEKHVYPKSEKIQFAHVAVLTKDLMQRRHLLVPHKLRICHIKKCASEGSLTKDR